MFYTLLTTYVYTHVINQAQLNFDRQNISYASHDR